MRIGVLGAGQLGRMLALAGYPLGFEFMFLDPSPAAPAGRIAPQTRAPYTDRRALAELAKCDRVTFEFENVPDEAAETLLGATIVYPPPKALAVSQDRVVEKICFRELGIPTAGFEAVDTEPDLLRGIERLGPSCILKTRRFGYDGKGQIAVDSEEKAEFAWEQLGGTPLVLEQFVPFDRELSLIAARGSDGSIANYPLVENRHKDGILHVSTAPALDTQARLQRLAEGYVKKLLEHLEYVGVLAVEFFLRGDELVANEFAPRVHNSGHLTIEGARTSQFENHLRAIADLPLGSTHIDAPTAMLNFVGSLPDKATVLKVPDTHFHDYEKSARPGRKLGHVTVTAQTHEELATKLAELERIALTR
jgi:5-(carboxyamino)imidazole ribonucleotide synthase